MLAGEMVWVPWTFSPEGLCGEGDCCPPPPLALGEGCVASPWSPLAPHTVSGSGQEPVPEGLYSSHVSEQLPTKAGVCLHPTHRSPWDQCGRAKPLTSLAQGPESNKEELKRHVE